MRFSNWFFLLSTPFLSATTCYAEAVGATGNKPPAPPGGSFMSLLPTLVVFALVFYFLLIRPQTKRAKDHRKLMGSLSKDDEVLTTGGVLGKITRMTDQYVILSISEGVEVIFQKTAIAMVLPKGTLKSISL